MKREGKYKILNLEGRQISNLKVIKRVNLYEKGSSQWLCKCICGKEKIIKADYLMDKRHPNKACGCLKNRSKLKHPRWNGYEEISGAYWNRLLHGAKARKIEFKITIEEAWDIFLKQNRKCALSGIELIFTYSYIKDYKNQTASLDRKDNSKEYTIDNIQWIHKELQPMKCKHSEREFKSWCKRVTDYDISSKST